MNIKFNTSGSLVKWSYLMISLPQGQDAFDQRSLTTVMQEFHQCLDVKGIIGAE